MEDGQPEPEPTVEGADDGQGGSAQPAMHEVVVNGEKLSVPVDKLIASYQQDAAYTQKFQKLSEDRKRFEELTRERATEMYMEALANEKAGKQDEQVDPEQLATRKLTELEERINKAEQTAQQKAHDLELKRIMDGLTEKYPNMDRDKVLIKFYNEAQEADNLDEKLGEFAKDSHESYIQMKQKILDDFIKAKKADPFSMGETGHSSNPPQKKLAPVTTWEAARERAEQRLNPGI